MEPAILKILDKLRDINELIKECEKKGIGVEIKHKKEPIKAQNKPLSLTMFKIAESI